MNRKPLLIIPAIILAMVVVGVSSLSAQEVIEKKWNRGNSLQKGSWAVQFALDENFQPKTFEGAVFNIKRHFSDRSALRLGLSLKLNFTSDDIENVYFRYPDDARTGDTESDQNSVSTDVTMLFLHYAAPRTEINFYYGVGPHLAFTRATATAKNLTNGNYADQAERLESTTTGWTFGAGGALGVEWFLRKSVSLIAEYGATLDYRWSKDSVERVRYPGPTTQENSRTRESFAFGSSAVKFGISLYF